MFYDAIKGTDAASQRAQLRTYVHELGHAFNMMHSWQKNLASPPAPLGPNGGLGDLSWMNYAWKYQPPPPAPGGENAYWADFPFQFTMNERVHLRHGFYRKVVMGANAFGTGAAEVDPEFFAEPVVDNSGLALSSERSPRSPTASPRWSSLNSAPPTCGAATPTVTCTPTTSLSRSPCASPPAGQCFISR